jgi:ABC-type sugar transport system ATPase subunit
MPENPILRLTGINKRFPGVYALKDISFAVYPGEVHALMGENGAGKSTLIKVISGVLNADSGEYYLNGEKTEITGPKDAIENRISVIYQELNLAKDLSVAENIFLGNLPTKSFGRVDYTLLYEKASKILLELGLNIDPRVTVKHLAVAQQQLVEIAKSIAKDPKIIIMDEPTSALSHNEIDALFDIIRLLKDKGTAIVYVSHKLDEIFAISQKVTVLRDGEFIGTCFINEIDEKKLISKMVGRPLSGMYVKEKSSIGDVIIEVENLSTDLIHNVSFSVKAGEIVGFSGLMGSGRTELCRAIFGLDQRKSGRISVCGKGLAKNSPEEAVRMGLGLVPENRKDDGIFPQLSVRANMTLVSLRTFSRMVRINPEKEYVSTEKMIESIKIKTPSQKQRIVNLSGGNQQKVILARWLMESNRKVLIIDEPTRGIDIGAKTEIYAILSHLASNGMSIIIMSSEMPEILGIADRIYVMKAGVINGYFNASEVNQEDLLISAT